MSARGSASGSSSRPVFWLYFNDTTFYVLLRDGSVWRPCVFSDPTFTWFGGEHRAVDLTYVESNNSLTLRISESVAGGGGGPRRNNANLSFFSDTVSNAPLSSPAVGDIVLGRAGSATLDGWLDDVAMYSL